jgi:iron complex transport system permease protein
LLAGLAFGASGAVFQTITRNPLASPDMIGINAGAATAVVAGISFGFGGGLGTTTLGLLLAGAGLVAFATASAGPISFVALTAPQIAQRLARLSSPPITASALTGAVVVLGSDILARTVTASPLPVGIVTGALGAPLLLWLLARANRSGSGG